MTTTRKTIMTVYQGQYKIINGNPNWDQLQKVAEYEAADWYKNKHHPSFEQGYLYWIDEPLVTIRFTHTD